MKFPHAGLLAVLAASVATTPQAASGQTYSTSFGGTGYACLNQSDGSVGCDNADAARPASFIWSTGDFWQQTITGSGLASVSSLALNLDIVDFINGRNSESYNVLVNGTIVGSLGPVVIGAHEQFLPFNAVFAAIMASTYVVEVEVSSPSVPSAGGAVGLHTDGKSTIDLTGAATTSAPEPSSIILMATGALGVVGVSRRTRRRARAK